MRGTVNLFVAVTDGDWFDFLSTTPEIDEVNFWQPGGRTSFKALQPGELFLFKLHSPNNFIVGGGIFAHASILPVSLAWEAFGEKNGAKSLADMRMRIAKYRREPTTPQADYRIGCRILEYPFFLPREKWIPIPKSWSQNIVVGKTYSTAESEGRYLWDAIHERIALRAEAEPHHALPRFGEPVLNAPRLGQGSFRVAVTDVYHRSCAVTGERVLPVLEAAHIRPYAKGGSHDISNGLLLRMDIHKLFDAGYTTVSLDGAFEVSGRIKEDFDNGRQYYALHGTRIAQPDRLEWHPAREVLEWHNSNVFLG